MKVAIVEVVEDEQSIAQMYKLKFEKEGYQVFTAENGLKGLEELQKHHPDVILLDLMMPEMTGFEMLKELRKKDWGEKTKVIILTNVSEEESARKVKELGVSDFIIKANTTPQQVVDTVKKVIAASEPSHA